jgi:hypothetical protein
VKRGLLAALSIAILSGVLLGGAAAVQADEPAEESRKSLSLDSLLSPRAGEWEKRATLRGGRDRESWRRDFEDARAEMTQLEGQVSTVQEQLRKQSDGAEWSYSPSGAGESVDPEIMKLRAHLRRDRASLEAARGRLRELEVEASLAQVPDHWVDDPEPTP